MVYKGLKTLSDIYVQGKRVLVRIDINSDIRNGKLIPSERLTAPLETVKELKKKGASIVLLAHQGRPGSDDFISLAQHAHHLNKHIPLTFIPDVIGMTALKAISASKPGQIILLENVRFVQDELKYHSNKPNKLIQRLTPLIDLYVNDAFSASHRVHASIVGFPAVMPSAIGRVFERELRAAEKLHIARALFVLGGSKPEDNLELVAARTNHVLASGLFGPFCLMAHGIQLGTQNKRMQLPLKQHASLVRKYRSRIEMPVDLAVAIKGKRADLPLSEFPQNKEIVDLGIETIEQYAQQIMHAKAVFFKGLAGLCNTPAFSVGTEALLRALMECKGFTVVSGGHTLTMIEKLKLPKSSFGYVSLSGGALMHHLAHGTLPGSEAMHDA